ncbi:MAG: hypothetical protein JNK05_36545 [Myxococcales bacterium]|nr:hypothetical protein [Myxococcales bacterium]
MKTRHITRSFCSLVALVALAACSPSTPTADAATDTPSADRTTPAEASAPTAECNEYCSTAAAHCDGANQLYPNNTACLAACAAFPTTGMRGDRAGNSVWCRLYHVDQPAAMDPATHCPHAGVSGGGVCQ